MGELEHPRAATETPVRIRDALLERWLSGRKRVPAKDVGGVIRLVGSNPTLSALVAWTAR